MASHRRVGDLQALEYPNRLPVLSGGDEDLIPARLEPLEDRSQDERMRGRRAIDPNLQVIRRRRALSSG